MKTFISTTITNMFKNFKKKIETLIEEKIERELDDKLEERVAELSQRMDLLTYENVQQILVNVANTSEKSKIMRKRKPMKLA